MYTALRRTAMEFACMMILVGNVNNSATGRTVKRKTANNLRVPKDLSSEKEGSTRFKMNANRCGIGDKVEVVTLWPNNEKKASRDYKYGNEV